MQTRKTIPPAKQTTVKYLKGGNGAARVRLEPQTNPQKTRLLFNIGDTKTPLEREKISPLPEKNFNRLTERKKRCNAVIIIIIIDVIV